MNAHQHHGSSAAPMSGSPKDLKDPVCGMTVTVKSDHKLTHEARTFYFCSAKCKGKFAANPSSYLAPEPPAETSPAVTGAIYTCPMHPEIRQDHPGNCPKCGMTLEPLMPDLEDDDNPELRDFQRCFWWTLPLMGAVLPSSLLHEGQAIR